jgi:hypothetical protein
VPRTRSRKAGSVGLNERDLRELRRLLRKAGSKAELMRCITMCPQSKRGRPLNKSLAGVAEHLLDYYGPAWGVDRKRAIAALKAREVKPPKGGFKFMNPNQTVRQYVEAMWSAHEEAHKKLSPAERAAWDPALLGKDVDAVTRRVLRDIRELKKRKCTK